LIISEIVHVHHVIVSDMVLHEMIVRLAVIIAEVVEEEEVVVAIILDVEAVVIITVINVNHINHVLGLIIINHHGKIVEEEGDEVALVAEEVSMIVNVIWAVLIDLMNSCHQVVIQ
jgi:hypothetical protein